jgi:hypothetical protein
MHLKVKDKLEVLDKVYQYSLEGGNKSEGPKLHADDNNNDDGEINIF